MKTLQQISTLQGVYTRAQSRYKAAVAANGKGSVLNLPARRALEKAKEAYYTEAVIQEAADIAKERYDRAWDDDRWDEV